MNRPAPADPDAFGRLVREHQHRLFALTLMMVRDPAAAEEVTQDAFVRACRFFDRYDPRRPFYPWLATIAVRLAQNRLRRHQRARESAPLDAVPPPAAAGPDPLEALVADERDRRLWRAVAALPSGERTGVYLYYRQEMPVADVARALGVTGGTVKTMLFRARRTLRRRLGNAGREEGP